MVDFTNPGSSKQEEASKPGAHDRAEPAGTDVCQVEGRCKVAVESQERTGCT